MGRGLLNTAFVRIPILLVVLFTGAVVEARHLTALSDYDVWWHLRTGVWILENHALPHRGLFSQYGDRPWIAYSWGFEVIVALAYKWLGLRAIPALLVAFKVVLAAAIFWMMGGLRRNFWLAIVLTVVGLYSITDLKVRPAELSILLLAVELTVLYASRRTTNSRLLFWLPPLFVVWANVHIQFVYGLFVLALFLGASIAQELLSKLSPTWRDPEVKTSVVAAVAGLCVLATLITPYTYHTYQSAWAYAHSSATYNYIVEMHAMNFRWPEHYVRLLLGVAAFFALGHRCPRDLFSIGLLGFSALIAFRQQRDAWCLVLVSLAVIAECYGGKRAPEELRVNRSGLRETVAVALLAVFLLAFVVVHYIPSDREALLAKAGQTFPVRACDAIRENHLPPPIFNPLNWGGFLTWYLPDYPVAIDGRTDLYGDEIVTRQYKIWDGEAAPSVEPTLMHARTLLLNRDSGLAQAVNESPGYRIAYVDDQAVVFVRQQ